MERESRKAETSKTGFPPSAKIRRWFPLVASRAGLRLPWLANVISGASVKQTLSPMRFAFHSWPIFLFAFLGSWAALRAAEVASSDGSGNPLLTPSPLPYGLPPFERIKDEHFAPAFEQAMTE